MPDRYVTLVLKVDETIAESMLRQVAQAADLGETISTIQLLRPGQLVGAWATDYMPEDPNAETRHLLLVTADSWVLQHPVSCRIGNRLWHCPITRACERSAALNGGVVWRRSGAGLYPVSLNKTGGLHFDVKAKEPLP